MKKKIELYYYGILKLLDPNFPEVKIPGVRWFIQTLVNPGYKNFIFKRNIFKQWNKRKPVIARHIFVDMVNKGN